MSAYFILFSFVFSFFVCIIVYAFLATEELPFVLVLMSRAVSYAVNIIATVLRQFALGRSYF